MTYILENIVILQLYITICKKYKNVGIDVERISWIQYVLFT